MKKIIFNIYFLLLIYVFLFNKAVFSALKINEIYPAPSSGEYEWVELFNDESLEIDIKGFYLTDLMNNKIKIPNETISPYGFIIATSSSILNNDGDTVYLKNNNQIIEIATYSAKFDSSKTFAKCPDGSDIWYILTSPTKGFSNESACLSLTPTIVITPSLTLTPTLITPILTASITPFQELTAELRVNYEKIYISEVMVNPLMGEKEWIELYNDNDFEVSLENWFVDDIENGGSSPRSFSIIIPPKFYGVVELSSAMFNNDGDNVRLLDFDKKLKDSFEYNLSVQGKTFGRTSFENDNFCLQEPSKGKPNNLCINSYNLEEETNFSFLPVTPSLLVNQRNDLKESTSSLVSLNKANLFFNPSPILTNNDLENDNEGEVLGLREKEINKRDLSLKKSKSVKTLSFLSLNYSLLSFVGFLLKILRRMKDL